MATKFSQLETFLCIRSHKINAQALFDKGLPKFSINVFMM